MPVNDTEINTIIKDENGMQTLVKKSDEFAKELKASGLTTSQIRALFGEVRQIEAEWKDQRAIAFRRLVLLQPKMAYRARSGEAVKALVYVLDKALKLVVNANTEDQQNTYFKHFVEFFEAILAYHKYHGGK